MHSHLVLASVFFCSYFHLFLESRTTSKVFHFLIFVLNALLSLQKKDKRFRASDLQQDFNCRDFAENAEEQKGIRFGTGYLLLLLFFAWLVHPVLLRQTQSRLHA